MGQSVENSTKKQSVWNVMQIVAIVILCVITVSLDFLDITFSSDEFRNKMLAKIIQQGAGAAAAILLMVRLKIRLMLICLN